MPTLSLPASSKSPFPAGTVVRVLLVDDHPIFRAGLRALIEQRSKYVVAGEAESAPSAISMADKLQPHLAIIDVSLQSANGIELTKSLHAQNPSLRILILSAHEEEVYAERALRAGAAGYLRKDRAPEELIAALECIASGKPYLSVAMKERLLHSFLGQGQGSEIGLESSLSDRELEVFELIGEGYGTREIAQRLKLSVKTIDSYREHLKLKLKLAHSSQLLRYAVQWARNREGRSSPPS